MELGTSLHDPKGPNSLGQVICSTQKIRWIDSVQNLPKFAASRTLPQFPLAAASKSHQPSSSKHHRPILSQSTESETGCH